MSTGRRRKLRVKHSKRRKFAGKRNPKLLAASLGRKRVRKVRGK